MKLLAISISLILLCSSVYAEAIIVMDSEATDFDTRIQTTPMKVSCDVCGGYTTMVWEDSYVFTEGSDGRSITLCRHCFTDFMLWAVDKWKAERIGEE